MQEKIAFTLLPFSVLLIPITPIPNRILLGLLMILLLIFKWPLKRVDSYQKFSLATIGLSITMSLFVNPELSKEFLLILTVPVYMLLFSLSGLSSAEMKKAFVNGVCLFALTLLILKLTEILVTGKDFFERPQWWNYLLYKNFAGVLGAHPTYLTLYFLSALILLLYGQDPDSTYATGRKNAIKIVLLLTTLLLSVKIALLFLMVLVIFHIFSLAIRRKTTSLVINLAIVSACIALTLSNPGIRHRIGNDFKNFQAQERSESPNRFSERMALWEASWHQMLKNPFAGASLRGISSRDAIFEEAKEIYPYLEFPKNSHNNFLEAGVRHGFPGMITLIMIAMITLGFGWKTKSVDLLFICLLFLFFSLTESFLFREQGITLFAVLLSIFGSNYARDI